MDRLTKKISRNLYASPCDEETEEKQVEQQWKLCNKLGQLEDIEELCIKMTTKPIYEKFSKTNICKLDFTGWNTAYDFKNNCIMVYKDRKATIYSIDEYGKTWALTRKELGK